MNNFGLYYTDEQLTVAAECVEALASDGVIPVDLQMRANALGINTDNLEDIADDIKRAAECEDYEEEY